jgi:hypothetical protein
MHCAFPIPLRVIYFMNPHATRRPAAHARPDVAAAYTLYASSRRYEIRTQGASRFRGLSPVSPEARFPRFIPGYTYVKPGGARFLETGKREKNEKKEKKKNDTCIRYTCTRRQENEHHAAQSPGVWRLSFVCCYTRSCVLRAACVATCNLQRACAHIIKCRCRLYWCVFSAH